MDLANRKTFKWIKENHLFLLLIIATTILLLNNLGKMSIPNNSDEATNSKHDIQLDKLGGNLLFPKEELADRYFHKLPLKTIMKIPIFKIFGFSPFSLRFLDAIMGILTIILIYQLGKLLFDKWIATLAGFILITTKAIYEGWARYNHYDSGYILGSVLFIYLFIKYFNTRLGWIPCSLALTFVIYFKHVMAIMTLGLIVIYLLINKRWKDLFSVKFIAMVFLALALVLIWAVPFQLQHPAFFKTFFNAEWSERVFKDTFGTSTDILYYIKYLTRLGYWLFLFVPSIFLTAFIAGKKRDLKILFIFFWLILPLILLTIATNKRISYYYISYPAIAYITAYSLVYIYRKFHSLLDKNKLIRICLPCILIAFILSQCIYYFIYTGNVTKITAHIVSDYYSGDGRGKLLLYYIGKNIHRPEYIHLYCADRKKTCRGDINTLLEKLSEYDAIIMSRSRYLNFLYEKPFSTHDLTSHAIFNYSEPYGSTISHPPMLKIGIIKRGGGIENYLKANGIELFAFNPLDRERALKNSAPAEFLHKAALMALGYPLSVSAEKYFLEILEDGRYTRDSIKQLFINFSRTSDFHYQIFDEPAGKYFNEYIIKNHPYIVLSQYEQFRNVTAIGIYRREIDPFRLPFFYDEFKQWRWHSKIQADDTEFLAGCLAEIKENEIILIKRSFLENFLQVEKYKKTYSRCCFFADFETANGHLYEQSEYPSLVIIGSKKSIYFKLLKDNGIETF